MAQSGMPALTRLGVTGLWQSSAHFALNGGTFFQERAVRDTLITVLREETTHDLIWGSMLRHTHSDRAVETGARAVYTAILVDWFTLWQPAVFRGVDAPFEEYAAHSRFTELFDFATPLITRASFGAMVSLMLLRRSTATRIAEHTLRLLFDETYRLWVGIVVEAGSVHTVTTHERARKRKRAI